MGKVNIIVETERLIIRLLAEEDVPALALLWTDEHVTGFMGGPRDFEQVSTSLRDDLNSPVRRLELWPVVERRAGTKIGHCGLLPKKVDGCDAVELVYVIAADHWGRGYAMEAAAAIRDYAFQELGFERLVSLIDPSNAASERVAVKIGMSFEAETVRPNGRTLRIFACGNRAPPCGSSVNG